MPQLDGTYLTNDELKEILFKSLKTVPEFFKFIIKHPIHNWKEEIIELSKDSILVVEKPTRI
jgi:hypothetical protein